ncbi:MAG: hypothetical protein WC711_03145 [Candidatus Staskawiczbacteria bacterium]|jgi:hypothetical protein
MENYKKKLYRLILLIIFLLVGSFYFPINKVFAQLEVKYPALPTITGGTTEPVSDLPSYVKYLFVGGVSIGFLIALISLVVAGVLYFISPINVSAKKEAKDRIMGSILGILILLLSYLIITTINPQLNIFTINKLESVKTESPKIKKEPGVYFYKESGESRCEGNTPAHTTNIGNFGDLKNQINSVDIVRDPTSDVAYIAILYEHPNFWGNCHYINPDGGCEWQRPLYSSASIHRYDFKPEGDGIYFFRKPCFNTQEYKKNNNTDDPAVAPTYDYDKPLDGKEYTDIEKVIEYCKENSGGWYQIENSEVTGKIYTTTLDDLKFKDVPEGEEDCIKYDKYNRCTSTQAPSLGGKNISSMIIAGDYSVVFYNKKDPNEGGRDIGNIGSADWSACQEFPSSYDIDKSGTRQIKWEIVMNHNGLILPDSVAVIPIRP